MKYAIISTEKGDMKAELYEKETPVTVENFVNLAGKRFYDGLTFHRVIPDFVIQGGCPRGDGTGGPGYTIPCETSAGRQYHDRGVLSMAHRGKDTGGSQFFICMTLSPKRYIRFLYATSGFFPSCGLSFSRSRSFSAFTPVSVFWRYGVRSATLSTPYLAVSCRYSVSICCAEALMSQES